MNLELLERESLLRIKSRRISQDAYNKQVKLSLTKKLKSLKRQPKVRESNSSFTSRVNADENSSCTQPSPQKDINLQSITIPEHTKSRKLKELIENQARKYELPIIKPLEDRLVTVEEDKSEADSERTSCSLAMRKLRDIGKNSNNSSGSRALNCKFLC